MIFSDCEFRKACREISPACGEQKETYKCYEKDDQALDIKKAKELHSIAHEFGAIQMWINEFIGGEHDTLPGQWEVQEIYEKYKDLVNTMG